MKKPAIVFFNTACIIGCILGIMHFFVPYSFNWYSYIPDAPIEIYQSITYVNFCFSLLLTGISLLLIVVQRKLFAGSKELKLFYVFFVLVWLSRVIIQIIWPWPSGLQTWLVVGFTMEFAFTLIPMIYFIKHKNISH
ncbi:MAG TPA: hypothetical protein PKW41_11860 [Clostridia bacterium]|jgi:hypothetical protein|nr:hypothetical protein [Clostridia bacterium]